MITKAFFQLFATSLKKWICYVSPAVDIIITSEYCEFES